MSRTQEYGNSTFNEYTVGEFLDHLVNDGIEEDTTLYVENGFIWFE